MQSSFQLIEPLNPRHQNKTRTRQRHLRYLSGQNYMFPGWDTNPSQVSSQQMLVLIYLPQKDRKLSQLTQVEKKVAQIIMAGFYVLHHAPWISYMYSNLIGFSCHLFKLNVLDSPITQLVKRILPVSLCYSQE